MSKKQQLKPYSAAHTLPHKTERTCGGGDGLKPHAISYKQKTICKRSRVLQIKQVIQYMLGTWIWNGSNKTS